MWYEIRETARKGPAVVCAWSTSIWEKGGENLRRGGGNIDQWLSQIATFNGKRWEEGSLFLTPERRGKKSEKKIPHE